ncbi:MAG: M48 family metalloprotease [Bacteroidetes bacterium]|nr:M48 family metalloprotease [Bacteroidota bacterium]
MKRLVVTVAAVMYSVFAVGCGSSINLFSKSEDVKLGQQMTSQIASDPKDYPVLNNPTVTGYVQGIVNTVLRSPNIKNRDFQYKVTIIHDDKTINAFSIPGGGIYVYTGLMKFIDNEATLAGILAHEITHADHRHSTAQMSKQYGLQIVAGLAVGQAGGSTTTAELVQYVTGVGGSLAMLRFSRDDERDADATSFEDLRTIPGQPYYPAAIKYFMLKTLSWDPKGATASLEKNLATHPPSKERLDAVVKQAIDAHLPSEPPASQLRASEYQRVRAMLP